MPPSETCAPSRGVDPAGLPVSPDLTMRVAGLPGVEHLARSPPVRLVSRRRGSGGLSGPATRRRSGVGCLSTSCTLTLLWRGAKGRVRSAPLMGRAEPRASGADQAKWRCRHRPVQPSRRTPTPAHGAATAAGPRCPTRALLPSAAPPPRARAAPSTDSASLRAAQPTPSRARCARARSLPSEEGEHAARRRAADTRTTMRRGPGGQPPPPRRDTSRPPSLAGGAAIE